MKGKLSVLLVFVLSAILMSSFIVIAAPAGLSFAYLDSSNESHIAVYTDYEGNLAGDTSNVGILSKTFYFSDDLSIVSGPTDRYIVFTVSGTNLSFTSHNIVLTSLCIKGGDYYRIFTFDPAAVSASGLYAPINNGGNIPAVSHYVLLGFQKPPVVPPTVTPTDDPPTLTPTDVPPTLEPTLDPTATPTDVPPTLEPTLEPTATPTDVPPTLEPTLEPTATPTDVPPTLEPTLEPTATPTDVPPTLEPTQEPTATPTDVPPTQEPTASPTETPSVSPSPSPTTEVLGATRPPTATPTTTVLGAVKTGEANYQTTIEIAVVLLAAFGTAGFVYVFRRRTSEE